ncbi:pentatricopeptide repeat-containing protein At2g33760-like [Gossypium hirsutum]|uniref:Pentatricopeptide repeat-containing protein At2g33760-like n=1 Tax=Gossypium hirsutum TaxID=3635 RepID=A0ABM2ZXZ0_GOSHI|nr:pentatricopeptide repeat-containing protein At2g33760-like [Gossypium hirsutum]
MGYVSQDMVLFVKIISSCVESGNLLLASSVHSLVLKSGFHGEALIDNSVLNMYSKCGDIVSARQVFEMVDEKCIFLWTSMIAANTQHGYPAEALDLFKSLLITDLKPNEATIASILSACADLGSLSIGNKIEHYVKLNGLASNQQDLIFSHITRPCSLDHVVFTSILLACSHSGLVEDGLKYFKSMKDNYGTEPGIEHYTCLVDLLG